MVVNHTEPGLRLGRRGQHRTPAWRMAAPCCQRVAAVTPTARVVFAVPLVLDLSYSSPATCASHVWRSSPPWAPGVPVRAALAGFVGYRALELPPMFDSRPKTAPDFVFSRPEYSVRTQGSRATFTDTFEAISALRSQDVDLLVGALPFTPTDFGDVDSPGGQQPTQAGRSGVVSAAPVAAFTWPDKVIFADNPLEPPAYYRVGPGSTLHADVADVVPPRAEHIQRVQAAINTMQRTVLDKVVLARRVDIDFAEPTDPRLIAARLLHDSVQKNCYMVDLSPTGGGTLVGSSPEVLVKKTGSRFHMMPLAGSMRRNPRATATEENRMKQQLLSSRKDLAEHEFVVRHLRETMSPIAASMEVSAPFVVTTPDMLHVATRIHGTVAQESMTALELAMRLHPTPAICGYPSEAALALIETAEEPRGFYAGAVGWANSSGDGEFMVASRCAEISPDGLRASAWAGGGIVEASDPVAEFDETTAKLRTIMRTMGIGEDQYARLS